ncbi:MAG: ABC-2 family transporter protein [Thermoflexales bacterium]|nr:ABC-2 family transporter protein [Thermoflexales bacterium]
MSLVRKYASYAKASWAGMLEYRAQILLWMLGSAILVVMLMVWTGVSEDNGGQVGGFSTVDFTLYYMIGLIVRNLTAVWASWELDFAIREGTLSPQLLRPINPIHNHIAANWVEKSLRLAIVVPLAVLVIALTPGAATALASSATVGRIALAALAVFGAWVIVFFADYLIGMTAFWTSQTSAFIQGWYGLRVVLSGTAAPVQLFPAALQGALHWLPFRYMLSFPLEILLGKVDSPQVIEGLLIQAAWGLFFMALCAIVWRIAIRSYSAVGA